MTTEKLAVSLLGAFFITVVLSITYYNNSTNTKIVEAIKLGASPFEAVCAMTDPAGDNPTCVITASKTKGEK